MVIQFLGFNFFLSVFIGVYLIYNVVLVSGVQQSDLVIHISWGFPGGSDGKESACNAARPGFNSWVRKIPWRGEEQPTPVFLPGEFYGQRSLVG